MKQRVCSTRRLLQYCQLPDKFPAIFRGIFGKSTLLKNCYVILRVLVEPKGSAELWLGNTALDIWRASFNGGGGGDRSVAGQGHRINADICPYSG
jgi:hypothetical protein